MILLKLTVMKNLWNPETHTHFKQTIIGGVMQEAGNRSVKTRSAGGEMLLGLLKQPRAVRSCVGQKESQIVTQPLEEHHKPVHLSQIIQFR